ncbi:DUF192 domain-containing protein [Aneurinibacillus danicus]|jgi:hypothetical protein|uniref:DUF192 domain-containing protein n=1 Tax=Aneurinibacillus danicus TaxID=267746 RepID=A0A511VCX3_9BACL|nr:DUF192 domain-containing protein [Aneurinibacillus danicus]GEN36714.1 hypothetical protein ADA01nite_41740 [Aneurinibacillus danicus]
MRFIVIYRNTVFFRVMELAVTAEELARGLLGRSTAGNGLFLMEANRIHTYGMRMAIDAVYLNKDGIVIGLEENIQPNREGKRIRETNHVVEFDTATIQKGRIRIGERWCWQALI